VQHHHAHVAGALLEHDLQGPVLGVSFDGTGLGDDGTLWGGEFLVATRATYRRAGWLAPVPLPGGEAAIREPWRIALALAEGLPAERQAVVHGDLAQRVGTARVETVRTMLARRFRCPASSGMGRMLDGIAALLGLIDFQSFEGQAPCLLEALAGAADLADTRPYTFSFETGERGWQVDWSVTVRELYDQLTAGVPARTISRRLHRTVIELVLQGCLRLRDETGLDEVALTGGVFQNTLLVEGCTQALMRAGFRVYLQGQVPCNDGGIAFGQLAVALARCRGKDEQEVP